jgi:hypothetical protein
LKAVAGFDAAEREANDEDEPGPLPKKFGSRIVSKRVVATTKSRSQLKRINSSHIATG